MVSKDGLDWCSGIPRRALYSLLHALSPIEDGCFVTNDERLLTVAQDHGIRPHFLAHEGRSFFKILRSLFAEGDPASLGLDHDEPVLVLDTRNPLLRAQDLNDAVEIFTAGKGHPVISMTTPIDHPYQLYHMDKVVWSGMLHFNETTEEWARCLRGLDSRRVFISKPFYSPEGVIQTVETPKGKPVDPHAILSILESRLASQAKTVFIASGKDTLRAVFPLTAMNAYLDPAVTAFAASEESPVLVQAKEETVTVSVDKAHCPCHVRLIPFCEGGIARTEIETIFVPHEGVAQWHDADIKGCTGFICSLISQGGAVDTSIQFNQNETLWKGRHNLTTGETITGRQNMPEVLIVEGSILVGSRASLSSPIGILNGGCFSPLHIEQERHLRLESMFDCIKWLSMNAETANCSGGIALDRPLTISPAGHFSPSINSLDASDDSCSRTAEYSIMAKNMIHAVNDFSSEGRNFSEVYIRLDRFASSRDNPARDEWNGPQSLPSCPDTLYIHRRGQALTPATFGPDSRFLTTIFQTGETCTLTLDGRIEPVAIKENVMDKAYHDGRYYLLDKTGDTLLVADEKLHILDQIPITDLGLKTAKFVTADGAGLTLLDALDPSVAQVSSEFVPEKVYNFPYMEYLVAPFRHGGHTYFLNSTLLPGGGEVIAIRNDGRVETIMDGMDMPLSLDIFNNLLMVTDRRWLYLQPLYNGRAYGACTRLPLSLLGGKGAKGQFVFRHPALVNDWLYYFLETYELEDPSTFEVRMMRISFLEVVRAARSKQLWSMAPTGSKKTVSKVLRNCSSEEYTDSFVKGSFDDR